MPPRNPQQGAFVRGAETEFCVWAPRAARVDLHLTAPADRLMPMARDADGFHRVTVGQGAAGPGARYAYRLNGGPDRPDPASRAQPDGVHGPSMVIDLPPLPASGWRSLPLSEMIIYELHVGTFTQEGTFEAIIPHLAELKAIGITTLELLPVAAFPGQRNWGYDGVGWYAAHAGYGGVHGLRRLIEAAHAHGLAVWLDAVFNHFGPEGNYWSQFAPYFSPHHATPWGDALNLDDDGAAHVRAFVLNCLRWWVEVGVDGFRLDAVQEFHDDSPTHLLRELADEAAALTAEVGRPILLVAEAGLNDPMLTDAPHHGGYGLHGEWSDDYHHALRALLTGFTPGYYADFGSVAMLTRAMRHGYARMGEFSLEYKTKWGKLPPPRMTAEKFIVFSQNHDQVGNRPIGDRLTANLSFEGQKVAAGAVLLSPFTPLLFMGEEYGEPAPFPFFVDHGPALRGPTRTGRAAQMVDYGFEGIISDPFDPAIYEGAKLNHGLRRQGQHKTLQDFYTHLIALRREHPVLRLRDREALEATGDEAAKTVMLHRWGEGGAVAIGFNFSAEPAQVALPPGAWRLLLCSWDAAWGGSGTPAPSALNGEMLTLPAYGFAVYE